MEDVRHSAHCPKLPWMIDFHSTAEGTIPNTQLQAAYANNFTDHLEYLDVHSQGPKRKLTGIICTLGDSCDCCCNDMMLTSLMEAGMTMVRLRMCRFTHEEALEAFKVIRRANDDYSRTIGRIYPLAIGLDIQGPEIRTGSFKDSSISVIELEKGNSVTITTDPAYKEHVTEDMIYVDYEKINEIMAPGDDLLLGDGEVRLSTIEIVGDILRCIVEKAGKILSEANVALPGIPVDLPEISEKDKEDLRFAAENGVDAVFISGIRNEETLGLVREVLGEDGKDVMVITKIDNCCALCRVDQMLRRSDALLVDRVSLGIEILTEKIFLAQKSIIAKCNKVGKPVICATHILESMLKHPEPTKSEASDIANAVLDGADCFLLSKETTLGEHPVESVAFLTSICKEAEAAVYQKQVFQDLTEKELSPIEPIYALAIGAVELSLKCNAAAIIVLTTSGRSAKLLARFRPRCPIIAITRLGHVARQLHLFRAIDPIQYISPLLKDWQRDVDQRIQLGITWGKVSGFVRAGDAIIILTGSRPGAGFTNSLKILYASQFDTIVTEEEE